MISNRLSNVVSVIGSIGVAGDYEFKQGEPLLDLLNRAKTDFILSNIHKI